MPVYEYRCLQGHRFDRFLKLANYGAPQSCECGSPAEKLVSAPFVRADIAPYKSPIDGRWIDSRAQRREDLLRNGCLEWDPDRAQEQATRKAQSEEQLGRAVEETFEAEVVQMPTRKRELLEQELRGGAGVDVVRSTPPAAALV